MPTDASIPLSYRPAVALEDPQTVMAKKLALQNQQQQSQVNAQQLQEGSLALQEKQRQIDQTAAVNQAYSDAFKVDPATGQGTLDTDSFTRALALSGHGVAIPGIVKATTDAQKAVADLADQKSKVDLAQRNAGGSIGAAVLAADGDPNLFLNLAGHAVQVGNANASTVQPILDHIKQLMQQDPTGAAAKDAVRKAANILISQSPDQTKLQAEQTTAAARKVTADAEAPGKRAASDKAVRENQMAEANASLRGATDQADYAKRYSTLDPSIATQFQNPSQYDPQKTPALNDQSVMTASQRAESNISQQNFQQRLTEFADKVRHEKFDEKETQRYHDLSLEGVTLTPEAMSKMAEMFAMTGVLPNLGLGKQAAKTRSDIINMAAQNFPNVDFAGNKASYQANTASLKNLQKTADQVDAFENTAGKNIDLFLKTAGAVIDTGSPFLNAPVRLLDDKFFGSEKMAAFKAARETALTEAAKVLESPQGSSALTVSGRDAVKTLSDPNATLAQQISSMKALRSDMANRKQSNVDQIKAIKDRISGGGDSTPAPAAVPDAVKSALSNAKPGIHKLSDGSTWMKAADGTVTKQ